MDARLRAVLTLAAALAAALVCSGAGCLFEPRTPESGGGTDICFQPIPANVEKDVFVNLNGSLKCKLSASYQVQFADNFVFIPAPSVAASFPQAFLDPWTLASEKTFSDRLFSQADSIVVDLRQTVDASTLNGTDPVSYEATYFLRYKPRGGLATVYRARARYTLRTVGGTFRLTQWEDFEPGPGLLTLGQLRGELFQ
jgi:hypothetical protein